MRHILTATAWVLLMPVLAPALAPAPVRAAEFQRQITVTGEGRVATAPDMATITLGVTHQAKEARRAMDATSDATGKMLDRLTGLGIAPRDMQTSNLTLNPIWSNRSTSMSGSSEITGFVAANTVFVRLRDLRSLGAVMDAVIDDGANNFNGLRFSLQNPDPLIDKARTLAVADALARAKLLTTAAGVRLGAVLSMAEHGSGRPQMLEMSAARGGDVPVAAGEVSVSATVSMVFAIKD